MCLYSKPSLLHAAGLAAYTYSPCIGVLMGPSLITGMTEITAGHPQQNYKDATPILFRCLLTHWGRDKMASVSQTILSNAFSWMKMLEFRLKFHWSFLPKDPINNVQALVQIMAWHRPGDKPLSEPMVVKLPMHICVTRPQWVNTLRPKQNK